MALMVARRCVALLLEAVSIHTAATKGGVQHWEDQVMRVASVMKDGIDAAQRRTSSQAPSSHSESAQHSPPSSRAPSRQGSSKDDELNASISGHQMQLELSDLVENDVTTPYELQAVRMEISGLEADRQRLQQMLEDLLSDAPSAQSTPRSSAPGVPMTQVREELLGLTFSG